MKKKVLLVIIDGLGVSCESDEKRRLSDASFGNMPYFDSLKNTHYYTTLLAHGEAVGLPSGIMGNSEVGHLNIGAGQVVHQLSNIITDDLKKLLAGKKSAWDKTGAQQWLSGAKQKGYVHLMGLVSDGLVHSSLEHLIDLIAYFKRQNVKVYLHAFLDGRDVFYKSAADYLDIVSKHLQGTGDIASISGRYFAMDRDNNLDRTQRAVNMVEGNAGDKLYKQVIESCYNEGIFDEFIPPTPLKNFVPIKKGDFILNFNFRADRARQITQRYCCENDGYHYIGLAKYTKNSCCKFIYENPKIENYLSKIVSENNLTQLKVAETEKYAHVTYFFNAQNREPHKGEVWELVNSKKVETYDLQPEMSASEITDIVLKAIKGHSHADKNDTQCEKQHNANSSPDFITVNYANCDMVGHTGNFDAACKACKTVDTQLKQIVPAAIENGYSVIITADHGNADQMLDKNGVFTQHTTNKVPIVLITKNSYNPKKLSDIAVIVLKELEL